MRRSRASRRPSRRSPTTVSSPPAPPRTVELRAVACASPPERPFAGNPSGAPVRPRAKEPEEGPMKRVVISIVVVLGLGAGIGYLATGGGLGQGQPTAGFSSVDKYVGTGEG